MNTKTSELIEQSSLVEKEFIPFLNFPKDSLYEKDEDLKKLKSSLTEATKLGNIDKGKITIFFEDNEGLKRVETTIWATGEHNIVLKGAVTIPIRRIRKIDFV